MDGQWWNIRRERETSSFARQIMHSAHPKCSPGRSLMIMTGRNEDHLVLQPLLEMTCLLRDSEDIMPKTPGW